MHNKGVVLVLSIICVILWASAASLMPTIAATQATNCTDIANPKTVTLESGLKYQITRACKSGPTVSVGDTITVHYVGKLQDSNKQFDSSFDHGGPATFVLVPNSLIEGWVEGIPGMKVGEKRTLIIPPALGYGEQGSPPAIPPNAVMIFDIEMLAINGSPALPTATPLATFPPTWTPIPELLPTWTPVPSATFDLTALDMTTATLYKSADNVITIKLPKGWTTVDSSYSVGTYQLTYATENPITFSMLIGDPASLYESVLGLTTPAENPTAALEQFIQNSAAQDSLKFDEIRPIRIANYTGQGVEVRIHSDFEGGNTIADVWIATAAKDKVIIIIMQAPEAQWQQAKKTLYQMVDSLTINLQNIPTLTPTATLHPLQVSQTAIQQLIGAWTPTPTPTATRSGK